jgi:hypothetical protein
MKNEDITFVAKLLTNLKDLIDELDSALKKNNREEIVAAKIKIKNLQTQISQKL